jgi:hypothetical protein
MQATPLARLISLALGRLRRVRLGSTMRVAKAKPFCVL